MLPNANIYDNKIAATTTETEGVTANTFATTSTSGIVELKDFLTDVIENRDGEDLDVIFICVPTPMLPNGDIDASIVQECVKTLLANTMATIVIKSTVTPN